MRLSQSGNASRIRIWRRKRLLLKNEHIHNLTKLNFFGVIAGFIYEIQGEMNCMLSQGKWLRVNYCHVILYVEQSCYRVADLYSYIEWGWCWWTIIILILKTLWLLECSFLHCWHSFLRLSDNVLRHRKTTPELWRAKEWWFYNFQFTSRSTHLVGGCSLFVS